MKTLNVIILWILIPCTQALSQQVMSIEYYFDKDPGYGLGKKIAFSQSSSVDLNTTLDLSSLQNGFHTLYLRAEDSNGKWSIPYARQFYLLGVTNNPQISKMEYFFDKDPGYGKGYNIPISPSPQVDAQYALNLSGLSVGTHILYVRAEDSNGNWSLVLVRLFAVSQNANSQNVVSSIQYYFVKDSVKSKTYTFSNFTNSSSVDLNFDLNLSDLQSNNSYHADIFAVTQAGVMSLPYSTTVNVIQAQTSISLISPLGGEQWYAGTTHNIQWSSSNISLLKLEFSSDSGATWTMIADSVEASQDSLAWLVPDINSSNCFVKIVSLTDSTYTAQSPSPFQIARQLNSPGWTYTITGNNHIILIPLSANPTINDTAIAGGDYIGVFYDSSGTLACGGYAVWDGTKNISVTAWGDDNSTPNVKEGFANGEVFKWRIWQKKTGKTFSAYATYTVNSQFPNDSTFVSNGISALASLNAYQIVNAIEKTQVIPKDFALFQNYPNPFNPSTTITYDIPKRSHILITIYDVLGRNVRTLVNEEKPAGSYDVIFDASNLPSGLYFYRISAGAFSQVKKMAVIK